MRLTDKETLKNNQIMKKYIIGMTLLLTLGASAPIAAQTPQAAQQQELVDSAKKDALEAFSDTTDTEDTTVVSSQHRMHNRGGKTLVGGLLGDDFETDGIPGMLFVLCVLLIIFVFSPLVIFGLLLYFIFRNRRQKMKLAQMAMQSGQPIPDQLLKEQNPDDRTTYQSGMRQLFLGIGLMVFLGIVIGKVGLGIGALVFFIGLGKVLIARKSLNDPNLNNQNYNRNNYQNSQNTHDYE